MDEHVVQKKKKLFTIKFNHEEVKFWDISGCIYWYNFTVIVQLVQKWLSGVSFASLRKVFLHISGVDRKTFLV